MDVDKGLHYLVNVNSCFVLSDAFSSFHQIFECVVSAVFQQNVNIFPVFERLHELHNMLVLQGSMDFDLHQKLVPLSFLVDGLFGDDFGCIDILIILADDFEALSKAACA